MLSECRTGLVSEILPRLDMGGELPVRELRGLVMVRYFGFSLKSEPKGAINLLNRNQSSLCSTQQQGCRR